MSWEMNGVSIESEEVFASINHELPRSAVVIFGADSELKARYYKQFRQQIQAGPLAFHRQAISPAYAKKIKASLAEGQSVLICMSGKDSTSYALRQEIVWQLHELGVKTVIGVYVKVSGSNPIDFNLFETKRGFDYNEFRRQVKSLGKTPPLTNEFDRFLVITS